MKRYIAGFMTCAILFCITPVSAAIKRYICYKTEYKIMINDLEYTDPDKPILNYNGTTYAPLRSLLEFAGFDVAWNDSLKQATATYNTTTLVPISVPIYAPAQSQIAGTAVILPTDDADVVQLKQYLSNNFSILNTDMGIARFSFDVIKNTFAIIPQDYWIMVQYDPIFFANVKNGIEPKANARENTINQLKDHQERLAKAVMALMPNKKFNGGYYNISSDHYYSWTNYDDYVANIANEEKTAYTGTTPSLFRWRPYVDSWLYPETGSESWELIDLDDASEEDYILVAKNGATTERFLIKGNRWRILYDVGVMGATDSLRIIVHNSDSSVATVAVNTANRHSGIAYIYKKGEFYLEIIPANQDWYITVEEYK